MSLRTLARTFMLAAACAGAIASAEPESPATGFEAFSEQMLLTAEQEATMERLLQKRATEALARLEAATSDDKRFYALPDAAMGAFRLGRFELAAELAAKSLEAAASCPDNWNYGNAIHRAHTVLGLLALREGKRSVAVRELHESGATPGSPQLGSFGPSMQLARALLAAGETDEVLAYLEQCRAFWKIGGKWLDIWEEKIRAGGMPNFFMNRW